jgi:HK97 family phage major capsid protein
MIPSVVMPGILEARVPASALLSAGAGIVPLNAGAKSFTTAAIDNIPTASWRLESRTVAVSDPTFRAVVAAPKSLAFLFKVSRELMADAPNMAQALNTAIAQAFDKELDRVTLRSSGVAPQPLGILGTLGIQTVANGANGTALAGYANLLAAIQAILQADAPAPLAAIMSPRSLIKLAGLTDSTGQPIEKPSMLENWKMIVTSQVPNNLTVGTSSDCSEIYVGDFSKVQFMMREQMTIQVASELFAGTGEIGFICHVRADVAVMYPKAIAVVTGVR